MTYGWNGHKPAERDPRTWFMHPEVIENRRKIGELIVTHDGVTLMRNGDTVVPDAGLPTHGFYAHPAKVIEQMLAGGG